MSCEHASKIQIVFNAWREMKFKHISRLGIEIIAILDSHLPLQQYDKQEDVVLSLAIYTSPSDPWTNSAAFQNATALLQKYHHAATEPAVLVEHILRDQMRPLFLHSATPAVTPAGRKAMTPMRRAHEDITSETVSKAWKHSRIYMLTVLRWALSNLNAKDIESNWPLLIPPILTLLDDTAAPMKAKGCALLTELLSRTSPSLLARTGLGSVMHDALMPCLLYLPPLTPVDESIGLLDAAYPALIVLSRIQYPSTPPHPPISSTTRTRTGSQNELSTTPPRIRSLMEIYHTGLLPGHAHCVETPSMLTALLSHAVPLVSEMGVHSVVLLPTIMPLLAGILADPFATASPRLILGAATAMRGVMVSAWPRVCFWKEEVLRGVLVARVRIARDLDDHEDEDGEDSEGKEEEEEGDSGVRGRITLVLRDILRLLRAIATSFSSKEEGGIKEKDLLGVELHDLVAAHPLLIRDQALLLGP
ncbi:MAG: hypothetical protein M1838_002573 [Thelocarpon superellum]|nr:MAG: hypothetical protein M1838_002573 [Thelocarpon superellum]